MSDSLRDIMRKAGVDDVKGREQAKWRERSEEYLNHVEQDADKDELEKRHDRFRRQQEYTSQLGPATERLPILSREETKRRAKERSKKKKMEFEGPIEKLIEKYKDPKEVFKHLSLGQLMKYELDESTGCIYEGEKMIFDGGKII
ncbi:MAG: hypothetical protein O7G87_23230 [bacterium]|nr:hypothetical protein [bacterium]